MIFLIRITKEEIVTIKDNKYYRKLKQKLNQISTRIQAVQRSRENLDERDPQ